MFPWLDRKIYLREKASFSFACTVISITIRFSKLSFREKLFTKFSGDFVERVTPVPIPNTEVKPLGADGTAREAAWESRKSPD